MIASSSQQRARAGDAPAQVRLQHGMVDRGEVAVDVAAQHEAMAPGVVLTGDPAAFEALRIVATCGPGQR
jgi:hypothetical protein